MLTALGDAFADISSDRGSTPLASTNNAPVHLDNHIDIKMDRGYYFIPAEYCVCPDCSGGPSHGCAGKNGGYVAGNAGA